VAFALAVRRRQREDPSLPGWASRFAWLAVALVLAQVTLGITNVLTRASVLSAIGHLTVASWLWATFVLVAARARYTAAPMPAVNQPHSWPDRLWSGPVTEEVTA